jgi:RES domain-containing protein
LNPSTALLETLVHMEVDSEDRPERFHVLKVEGPDTLSLERFEASRLPPDWADDTASTQAVGDVWLSEKRSLLLEVPSVLVPETWNVLVNPLCAEASLLKVVAAYEHAFDTRFF